jgi:hypothetical protein
MVREKPPTGFQLNARHVRVGRILSRIDIGERLLVGVTYHDAKKAPRKAGPFELPCA